MTYSLRLFYVIVLLFSNTSVLLWLKVILLISICWFCLARQFKILPNQIFPKNTSVPIVIDLVPNHLENFVGREFALDLEINLFELIFYSISINGYRRQSNRVQRRTECPPRWGFISALANQHLVNWVPQAVLVPPYLPWYSSISCLQYSQNFSHCLGCIRRGQKLFRWSQYGSHVWVV